MSAAADLLAERFEGTRRHLTAVAYRLTGSVADAEDAVQEAWLRLAGSDTADIRDLEGWLVRVVARISMDRLRSAAVRREHYIGSWLPEPVVVGLEPTGSLGVDPLEEVVRQEDYRIAALVVLDALGPDQRVAFVLHDGFGIGFDVIAEVLDVTVQTARQLASRARRLVAEAEVADETAADDAAVAALLAAVQAGDLDAVVAALHPDARMIGDANGTTRTAVNVIVGAEKVARFVVGLVNRYGAEAFAVIHPALVNGTLGYATPGHAGDDQRSSFPARVGGFTVVAGQVWGVYDFANPEKLKGVRIAGFTPPATPPPPPTTPRTH